MLYTKRKWLTVLELNKGEKDVSIEELKTVLIEKPSNMIYCESDGKLNGVISMGDIWRALQKNERAVPVNRKFTYLYHDEYAKAKEIFKIKEGINALPVITENNVLTADYTRWEDLMILEYLIEIDNGRCIADWVNKEPVILVRPGRFFVDKQRIFKKMKMYLELWGITVKCIDHLEAAQYEKEGTYILFVDENEIRACNVVRRIVLKRDANKEYDLKTYRSIFNKNFSYSDEDYISYLNKLQKEGVRILGLEFGESIYYQHLLEKLKEKFAQIGEIPNIRWPKKIYEDFFDDLYSEEYADSLSRLPLTVENHGGVFTLKDYRSKYYNIINGERHTVNQPDKYTKSVYFFGPCYIRGVWVEDKNTIESLLQERICQDGLKIRVVNCGTTEPVSKEFMYLSRIAVTPLKKGDIIVVDRPPQGIDGVQYLDLNYVLEKNNVGTKWMLEMVCHCNHKVNKIYANEIYDMLATILREKMKGQGELIKKDEDFVKLLYLDRYFKDYDPYKYKKVGAILMHCNPFTYGHRYLIEQALQTVDFLIVFVVEQDKSFFSFAERFLMAQKGVEDLKQVKVVPSGQFMGSQMTVPEYFGKQLSESLAEHCEQDLEVFAKEIALPLNISARFLGEEPLDAVTRQYNISAQKVLPKYDIDVVVIPRKTVRGRVISASEVRKCLIETGDFSRLNELLPETTRKILGII